MREIKFRGKRTDNGEWVCGHFFEATEGIMRTYNMIVDKTTKFYIDYRTVGQFVGLLDKNGKEIYEGDVVECDAFIDEVVFEKGIFSTKRNIPKQPLFIHLKMNLKVIGNQYG